jgi:hypothetical protein
MGNLAECGRFLLGTALASSSRVLVAATCLESSSVARGAVIHLKQLPGGHPMAVKEMKEIATAFVMPPILLGLALAAALSLGCDNKETVLDVETPGGGVEVERDRDTGAVDVDVEDDDDVVDVEREPDGGVDVDVNAN